MESECRKSTYIFIHSLSILWNVILWGPLIGTLQGVFLDTVLWHPWKYKPSRRSPHVEDSTSSVSSPILVYPQWLAFTLISIFLSNGRAKNASCKRWCFRPPLSDWTEPHRTWRPQPGPSRYPSHLSIHDLAIFSNEMGLIYHSESLLSSHTIFGTNASNVNTHGRRWHQFP